MTATQITPRPSAGASSELVCRPLIAMASRGFDKACLLQMQDAAFRFAAQSLQNNKSASASGAALWVLVDQQLGGSGKRDADVLPGHIAAYMSAKAFLSQLPQRDAMFDVAALSIAAPGVATGLEPRITWLARTLAGLQRDADRLAATTPMFASEIAAQVRRTVGKRSELEGLSQAMRAAAAHVAASTDDEHVDLDEHPRNSYS